MWQRTCTPERAKTARGRSFTERLARTSAAHPWRTIAIWGALIVLAFLAVGSLLGSALTSNTNFHYKIPDSVVGQNLIQDRLTGPQKLTDFVIVRSATETVNSPAVKGYVDRLADRIDGLGSSVVSSATTFYQTGDPALVSKDRHATLITVTMAGSQDRATKNVARLHSLVVADGGHGFALAQTGQASLTELFTKLASSDLERGEIFGVPAALIVLVVVFGALLAATMPLVLSVISILLGVALVALIGQIYPMSNFVLNILTMMGLAVGIDYTLLVVSRYREERACGLVKIDAIAATGATASRAIFFSGMTVILAMTGMAIVPHDLTIGMGVGVMLVVICTLLSALILLPAVLSILGDRVNALRVPLIGRRAKQQAAGRGGLWEKLARSIMRHPVTYLAVAVVALLAAAAPATMMKTGDNMVSATYLPKTEYATQGWDILSRDFSLGQANPVQIVIDGPAHSSLVKRSLTNLEGALKADGSYGPSQVTVDKTGDLTVLTTTLAGGHRGQCNPGGDQAAAQRPYPAGLLGTPAKVYLTGTTAGVVDYLAFFRMCGSPSPSPSCSRSRSRCCSWPSARSSSQPRPSS